MPDDPKSTATPTPTVVPAGSVKPTGDGHHAKTWKGQTVWECDDPFCPYDSTDEAKVAAHVQSMGHQGG